MSDPYKGDQDLISGDSGQISLRAMPIAAFIGYRQFPLLINLYVNYSSILSAVKSYKLYRVVESDFRYLVEYHLGYTPRGPLNFGRGFYLRNGKNFRDPILAVTGEQFPLPLLVLLFDPETVIKLPPLDMDKNLRDMVDEVLRAATSKEYRVIFRFTTEVGRAAGGGTYKEGGYKVKTRYTLYRLASSTIEDTDGDDDLVAVLSFNHILSVTYVFTLEMKGTGLTGELGDR
ncbi:hypothetical protein C7999DRAFT_41857 [Corynascus novoguineensis]|uniref:Uncharacterized protein n=1 Tax=Corynascus novoguineensis TaxID=1126955 RepID=A0AAN7CT45_9PEZI|nr:hypothetical protein C7999DRAFT_41857 [Corynascus novoguineensis]